MKAILIDPQSKTITDIEIGTDYREIYKVIGNGCKTFTCPIEYPNDDAMYADDEGLFNKNIGAFIANDGTWGSPIVGRAVILGTDMETGESQDCKSTAEELKKLYNFIDAESPALKRYFEQFS